MFTVGKVVFRSPFDMRRPGDDIEIRQKENATIETLRKTVEGQRQTIVLMQRKIDDLSGQNEEYRKSRVVSPQEEVAFKNQSRLLMEYQEGFNRLALWLRENKSVEIAQGKHEGKDLIPLILQYLGGTLPEQSGEVKATEAPDGGKIQ